MEEIKAKIKSLDEKNVMYIYYGMCLLLMVLTYSVAQISVNLGGFSRGSHGLSVDNAGLLFIGGKSILAILYYVITFFPLVCGIYAAVKKSINVNLTLIYGCVFVLFGLIALFSSNIGLAFGWFLCLVLIGALCYFLYVRYGLPKSLTDIISKK